MARCAGVAKLSALLLGLSFNAVGAVAQTPVVSSASHRTVSIAAGGPASSVVLLGKGLSAVSGAIVTVRGAPVTGLTLSLLGASETKAEINIQASPDAPAVTGQLVLVTKSGEYPVPVELQVSRPPVRLIGIDPISTDVQGGEPFTLSFVLDRPAEGRGTAVKLSVTPAGVVALPPTVRVPAGSRGASLSVSTISVTQLVAIQMTAALGLDELSAVVSVLPPPVFVPIITNTPGLMLTGSRFQPVTTNTPGLMLTGSRFRPVTTNTPGLMLTGSRFRPVTTSTPGLVLTGNRFSPIVLTANGLVMTGLRFPSVTLTANGLAMTGLRFPPVEITANPLVMTGIR